MQAQVLVAVWQQVAVPLRVLRLLRFFKLSRYSPALHTLARVLQNHTDVLTAQNAMLKARYNLRLAKVTPVPSA